MVYRFCTVPMTQNSTQLKNPYQISWLWSTENHHAPTESNTEQATVFSSIRQAGRPY